MSSINFEVKTRMLTLFDKARTLFRLGLINVWRVFWYRALLRLGLHPVQRIHADVPVGNFIDSDLNIRVDRFKRKGQRGRQSGPVTALDYFGYQVELPGNAETPPDWHNPFRVLSVDTQSNLSWWLIDDFDDSLGDIKTIWEFSRLDWLLPMAQRAANGDRAELKRLNEWVSDWAASNIPYKGRNWKCGQEASIRVMHIVACLIILDQVDHPSEFAKDLIRLHLIRIASTIGYAIGQANNHGTSEAAALFIGGNLVGGQQGKQWQALGRRYLENRCNTLIEPDGTFSQYSVNYHRMMLDTFSFCESWRQLRKLEPFSKSTISRLSSACEWLQQLVDMSSGDVPNLGANDGAHILNLSACGYRDFRPSVQWASVMFKGVSAYPPGQWDEQLEWLDVDICEEAKKPLKSTTW